MFTKNQVFGKYKILDALGSGGFGTVYLAEDMILQKRVAMKVPHEQSKSTDKVRDEARILAKLDHPYIVRVISAEVIENTFVIVMDYMEGGTMMNMLKGGNKLPVKEAVELLSKIGEAVEFAHSKNILHRDLRPSNVLMSTDKITPKVADFGTSRLLEAAQFAKTRIGSPPYMPPEQFDGKATFASDVYALGIMAYRMVTGKLPFFDANPAKIEALIKNERAIPANLVERSIPKKVSDVIMKAIEKDPADRTPHAGTLIRELNEAVEKVYQTSEIDDIRARIAAHEKPRSSNCWKCHKPIPARSENCPYCRESQ